MRRNTHKPWPDGGEVFDSSIEVPVTIRNPEKPIGTHVFTAMARNDAGLRWTAVTIDDGDDAKGALDRITIPQDVLDRIAPTALPRSSIIISDEPLSKETNYRTEFVAVLSNQPQGGFITRKPTEVSVAGDNGFSFFRSWDFSNASTRQQSSGATGLAVVGRGISASSGKPTLQQTDVMPLADVRPQIRHVRFASGSRHRRASRSVSATRQYPDRVVAALIP